MQHIKGKCPDGSNNKPEREDDYVRYVVKVLKYLEKKGLGLPLVMAFRTTDAGVLWDGCVYSKEQFQRVAKKRAAFDANGQKVKIHGPEGANMDGNWSGLAE